MKRNLKATRRKRSQPAGQVRIVGGLLRRSSLQVADSPGLRPTPDRVRETVFNWLGHQVSGANCLDLFAGTGALGLEAASRGAGQVILNDTRRDALGSAAALIARAADSTDEPTRDCASRVSIRHENALTLLGQLSAAGNRMDLVFLDPPFGQEWLNRLLPAVGRVLTAHGMVYVESEHSPQTQQNLAPDWTVLRCGNAGQVYFYLLQPARTPEPS